MEQHARDDSTPEHSGPVWNPPTRRRARIADRPRQRIDTAALFGLAPGGWNWSLALSAAVAMAVAFSLGTFWLGPPSGVLAALGSFTVLYETKTPYVRRVVSLAVIGAGFAGCVALGTLSSVTPWTAALAIGLVAAVATWICQSLRVDSPAAFMFILVCAIATINPGGPADVPRNVVLAVFGAGIGWLVSMSGIVVRKRSPENRAIATAFRQLARLLRAIGTERLDHVQHEASLAVAEAWRILLQAQTRGYRETPTVARLRTLLRWVSDVHLAATDVALARREPLPETVPTFVEKLAGAVGQPQLSPDPAELEETRRGLRPRSLEAKLYGRLARAAQAAGRTHHTDEGPEERLTEARSPSVREALRSGAGGDTLIRPTALRLGITVAAAGLIGILLGVDRFYWISLTTASVLQGGNVVLTANRSAQRSLGTVIGVLIGAAFLLSQPPIALLIITAAVFHGLSRLLIARNFFYATILLTPMALILAHTARPYDVAYLAQGRVIDTLLGALIGVSGAVLLWRRAAATRLPQVIVEALKRSRAATVTILDPDTSLSPSRRYQLRRELRAALISLRSVYDSAIGDIPRATHTQPLWPVVIATQRVGYLALAALASPQPPSASHITSQRVDRAFAELIDALWTRRAPRLGALPRLTDYPRLNIELRALAAAVRTAVAEDERAAAAEHERRARRERERARADVDADL